MNDDDGAFAALVFICLLLFGAMMWGVYIGESSVARDTSGSPDAPDGQ